MKNWLLLTGCIILASVLGLIAPLVAHHVAIAQWGGGPLIAIQSPSQAPKLFLLPLINNCYWLLPGTVYGYFSRKSALQSGAILGVSFALVALAVNVIFQGFPRYSGAHLLAPTIAADILNFVEHTAVFFLSCSFGAALKNHSYAPNNSFKPTSLRGAA